MEKEYFASKELYNLNNYKSWKNIWLSPLYNNPMLLYGLPDPQLCVDFTSVTWVSQGAQVQVDNWEGVTYSYNSNNHISDLRFSPPCPQQNH